MAGKRKARAKKEVVRGDNKQRDIALNAAFEEWCELQKEEDDLMEEHVLDTRQKKNDVAAKARKDWDIPAQAFSARANLRYVEKYGEDEVILATQQCFDATPVGANLDLVAIAERVTKKKDDEKAEAAKKAKAKADKKTKATEGKEKAL